MYPESWNAIPETAKGKETAEELSFSRIWCAVLTDDPQDQGFLHITNTGFFCDLTQSVDYTWDKERYPNLFVWNEENVRKNLDENLKDEDFMTSHFVSLLNYLADQEEFLKIMDSCQNTESAEDLRAMADYVEANGLQVYGFAAIMDKDTALELNKEEAVYLIDTEPLR